MVDRKKPELLVNAKNITEFQVLVDSGADAILVGESEYALRLHEDFTLDMISSAVQYAHEREVRVYVLVDALFDNQMLSGLELYLIKLAKIEIDAIVMQDPAVLLLAKKYFPNIKLHINTGTTITNKMTIEYWEKKGINRAVVANELSLDEISYIKKNTEIEIEVQIQGLTSIFYSKRKLLTNYFKYIKKDDLYEILKDKDLFLREQMRPDEKYPVVQDRHGTHVMSNQDICMIEYLKEILEISIDSLKINGFLYALEELVEITKIYRKAIDKIYANEPVDSLILELNTILPKNRSYGTGFYFKEQIY